MELIRNLISYNGWKLLYRLPCQGLIFFGLGLAWVGFAIGDSVETANQFWNNAV